MATSGTYTVTKTAADMANAISRVATMDRSPSSSEVSDIIEAMNFWLFQVQEPPYFLRPGDHIWQRETADVTLSAKIAFDLKPSGGDCDIQIPIEIITANLKDTDNVETPMTPMSLEDFQAISDKTQAGTPGEYYYERRLDTGKLYLNIIPSDTTDVIDIVYRQPLEIITAATDNFDIERYFYRAMKFAVAVDIAPEHRVDSETVSLLIKLRDEAMAAINAVNPEQSDLYFQPGVDE